MNLTMRYGLIGIAALALLSAVSWIRGLHLRLGPIEKYLLGVMPDFLAAIAITFVLLSIWADQKRDKNFTVARHWFSSALRSAPSG